MSELDEQDRAEVASLLRLSQRPANRTFLAALCSTSATGSATQLNADDAGEVEALLRAGPQAARQLSSQALVTGIVCSVTSIKPYGMDPATKIASGHFPRHTLI